MKGFQLFSFLERNASFEMPCLSAFGIKHHSVSGQLLPAKLSLWLSAQITEPETLDSFLLVEYEKALLA